jgi:signal recognition particle receptor subunit beta
MVLFNYSTKELTAKVVYYGPGLCGKTTNLQWIHEKLPIKNKGKMLSLATETDRTLFFDFLPIELGTIRGMKTRIQLYTVPGQVFYNATRRMVLKGADCVVFVCDSQEPMLDANLESLENMRQNLEANEIDPDEIPMVLQYNKRDLPNALPIEILNERLNPRGLAFNEAVAIKGIGVEDTLKSVTVLVFKSLSMKYGTGDPASAARAVSSHPAAAPPAPPPAPARRPPATATMPPSLHATPESGDDLLDQLDLGDTPHRGDTEELPMLQVEDDDLPMPGNRARSPAAARPAADPRATIISGSREVQDLRRRITPQESFDLNLEEPLDLEEHLEEEPEHEEIEEIALESDPEPAPVPVPRAPRPAPLPTLRPAAAAPPVPRPASPPALRPTVMPATRTPVTVEITGNSGQTDISIPVEVSLDGGTTQVNLNLRLTLNVKVSR